MEIKRLITEPILLVKMGMMTKKYRFRFKTYRGGKNQNRTTGYGDEGKGSVQDDVHISAWLSDNSDVPHK